MKRVTTTTRVNSGLVRREVYGLKRLQPAGSKRAPSKSKPAIVGEKAFCAPYSSAKLRPRSLTPGCDEAEPNCASAAEVQHKQKKQREQATTHRNSEHSAFSVKRRTGKEQPASSPKGIANTEFRTVSIRNRVIRGDGLPADRTFCRRISTRGPSAIPMPKAHSISGRVTTLLLLLLAAGFAAEPRRIAVYTPQTNYQVDILVRDGVDYVGLTDLLEPLGRLESRIDGKRTHPRISMAEPPSSRMASGSIAARSTTNLKLPSNFLLVDGRGYIPVASMSQMLPHIAGHDVRSSTPCRAVYSWVRHSFTIQPNCVMRRPGWCSAFLFRSTLPA